MNINKLFRHLNIRLKLTIAFALLSTIPLILTGLFGMNSNIEILQKIALHRLNYNVLTVREKTETFLANAESDIYYLYNSVVFQGLVNALSGENELWIDRWRAMSEQLFSDFANSKQIYYQIRFVSRDGDEILRIDYDNKEAKIVPHEQLSSRREAFYLHQVMLDSSKALRFSPIELTNLEDGKSLIPAISYFLPVYDAGEELQGILIANIFAYELFHILDKVRIDPGSKTILVNQEGFYLYHSEKKKEWNQLLASKEEGNLTTDYTPETSEKILSGEFGVIEEESKDIISYAPLFPPESGNFLVIFHTVPKDVIFSPVRSFVKLVLIFGFFTLAIAVFLGFLAANHFTRPIDALSKGAEILASGNLDHRLDISTNDEIESLANDFNQMAQAIKERENTIVQNEKQLAHYAEDLENKVKERTGELNKALNYLENLIESSIDAIITLDNEGKINFFSKGAVDLLGYSQKELIGQQICSYCEGCDNKNCAVLEVSTKSKKLQNYRIDFVSKSGDKIPLNMSVSPLRNENNEVIGILTISKDMREILKLEEQVKQHEQQIVRSEKMAATGRLSAGVAHEINNPISIILNRIECLQLEADRLKLSEDVQKDFEVLKSQAKRVSQIASSLLTFSREHRSEFLPVNLTTILNKATGLLGTKLKGDGIELDRELEEGIVIKADPNKLEQVFLNVFMNAVDAMPAGGKIEIKSKKLKKGNRVKIEISDTGTGISKENMDKIFDPFFTTKEVGEGTGLGLYVSYGIAQEHGGSINVKSKEGKGTTFVIELPVDAV